MRGWLCLLQRLAVPCGWVASAGVGLLMAALAGEPQHTRPETPGHEVRWWVQEERVMVGRRGCWCRG